MKKNILFLLSNTKRLDETHKTGIWLCEFSIPYIKLKGEGYKLTTVSPLGGCTYIDEASIPEKTNIEMEILSEAIEKTEKLSDIDYNEFDAVVVPGGHAAMIDLADNIEVSKLLGLFFYERKIIATICHGGAALLGAKTKDNKPIIEGKNITAFSNDEEKLSETEDIVPFLLENRLKDSGAKYSCGKPFSSYIIENDNLITAQNPQSSEDFAKAVSEKLKENADI